MGWVVPLGVVVLLVGVLAVAVYSPLLALRTISIEGASAVSPEKVHDAIDDQLGTPLALLDYGRIRSELDAFPLIRSFVTEVVPPSTLVVHLVERAPIGAVATPTGFAVVDPAGVVLDTTATRKEGVPLIEPGAGGTDSVAFSSVVDVLLALPESIRSRVDVARATSKDDVRLVLTGVGQRIVWGSAERSALKARVLQELMAAQGKNSRVEYDVSAPLSPVVRPG
jgi:cell division protein FtsQ